jgi:hypothetical protein
MNNIGLDGELVLTLVRSVPETLARPHYDLRPGDVLVCTTNSAALVGKCAFFDLIGRYTFSNHLTRLRANPEEIDGRYLRWYLWLHTVAQSGCVCFHCRSHHGGLRRRRLARDVPVRQFGPKLAPRPRFLLGRSLYYKTIPAERSIVPAGRWSVFQRLESPEFRAADRHRRDTRETGNASRFRCSLVRGKVGSKTDA